MRLLTVAGRSSHLRCLNYPNTDLPSSFKIYLAIISKYKMYREIRYFFKYSSPPTNTVKPVFFIPSKTSLSAICHFYTRDHPPPSSPWTRLINFDFHSIYSLIFTRKVWTKCFRSIVFPSIYIIPPMKFFIPWCS